MVTRPRPLIVTILFVGWVVRRAAPVLSVGTVAFAHPQISIPSSAAAKLIAADGSPEDWFSYAVAIDGETAVVGAPRDEDGRWPFEFFFGFVGSAYVFQRGGDGWLQKTKLRASDGADGATLGFSVALSGDVIVAGAPGEISSGVRSGTAYVFRKIGAS